MKKRFGDYRRLAKGMFGCSSLWAGTDHLVYVKGSGVFLPFVEEYKRFRYADIQAMTTAPTSMYYWTAAVYGLGAILSTALIFLPDYGPGMRIVILVLLLPVAAVCVPCLVVTLARGPSCRCRIHTAVGSVVIRPLSRVRVTERAIGEISGLVKAEQGDAFEEGGGEPGTEGEEGAETAGSVPVRKMEQSIFIVPTFILLILFGAFALLYAHTLDWWILAVAALIDLALFLGVVVTLVQQMRGFSPSGLLAILWAALLQQILLLGVAFFVYLFWAVRTEVVQDTGGVVTFMNIYREWASSDPVYYGALVSGIVSMSLGLAGLGLIRRYRSRMGRSGRPPQLPREGKPGGDPSAPSFSMDVTKDDGRRGTGPGETKVEGG